MKSGIEELANQLRSLIFTSTELKAVSTALEILSQSKSFKSTACEIASDPSLSDGVKKTQMLYLFKDIDVPVLYSFFADLFSEHEFWLFASKQFDYFDEFVQQFQLQTEKVLMVNIVTALDVQVQELNKMAKDLTKSFGQQVILHPQVNPAIIGGVQVRIGNLIFDYSLRSKFQQFQRQWLSSIAKTSELVGRD